MMPNLSLTTMVIRHLDPSVSPRYHRPNPNAPRRDRSGPSRRSRQSSWRNAITGEWYEILWNVKCEMWNMKHDRIGHDVWDMGYKILDMRCDMMWRLHDVIGSEMERDLMSGVYIFFCIYIYMYVYIYIHIHMNSRMVHAHRMRYAQCDIRLRKLTGIKYLRCIMQEIWHMIWCMERVWEITVLITAFNRTCCRIGYTPGPHQKSSWKSAILIEFYVLASISSPFCSTAMAQLFFGGCLTWGCAFVSLF